MGTEGIAAVVAAAGSSQAAGKQYGPGGQNGQISQLQYLEQTIRKMENDYQYKARVQGVSSIEIHSKVRAFDNLIAKVDEQIEQLQQTKRKGSSTAPRGDVSSLHYSTAATMVALRNSGQSIHSVLTQTSEVLRQKSRDAEQAARKAERMAQEEQQAESLKRSGSASLDVLV